MSASWNGVDQNLHDGFDSLAAIVANAGGQLLLTSTIRTTAEQTRLYKRYLAGASGGIPAAPPLHSAHEYGWAFDAVANPREWQFDVGAVWTQMGGKFGGKRDPVHFELPNAGAVAWSLGEQAAGGAGGAAPDTQSTVDGGIGLLPLRWRKRIYQLEDMGLSFVPVESMVILVSSLLKIGFPDSEILAILQAPVEELHARFPWIPF